MSEIERVRMTKDLLHSGAAEVHGTRSPSLAPYESRIKFLQDEATHDGYALNYASKYDFERFIEAAPDIRRGDLVLMDNGNMRAIWKDEQGTRLGLQFLGGGMVQYVIFKQRRSEQPISRIAGRDSMDGLARQIDAFELRSLLFE